jgi:hypothetical protein
MSSADAQALAAMASPRLVVTHPSALSANRIGVPPIIWNWVWMRIDLLSA